MATLIKAMSVVLIAAMLVATRVEAALSCNTTISLLTPCFAYVANRGPIGKCCGGVNGLYNAARTTTDRRTVCVCLKNLASGHNGINYGRAAGLPKECGLNIPYKISPSTDCTKVR